MRVALIAFKSLAIYAMQLANGLSRITDLHLFMADGPAKRYADMIDPGVKLHPVRTCRYRNPAGLLVSIDLMRDIRKLGCDIAHLIQSEPWFNACIPFIRAFPLITTVHDVRHHAGDRRSNVVPQWVADLSARFSASLIVHGAAQKTDVCREFGIAPQNVFAIPMLNFSFYRKWEKPGTEERPNNILFFGSIWPYKGLRYLMEAEGFLARELRDFRITVAGTGEEFTRYEKYILDRSHYEIINEHIPDERVAELFQKASVVVLPYIEASQTAVAPIAFSFGKPVVATRVGSIPELVSDGEDGFIVEPCRPDELARAILAILKDPVLKQRMSAKAMNKAYNDLSEDRVAQLHMEAYAQTVEAWRARQPR